jgi:hypothetical protein
MRLATTCMVPRTLTSYPERFMYVPAGNEEFRSVRPMRKLTIWSGYIYYCYVEWSRKGSAFVSS